MPKPKAKTNKKKEKGGTVNVARPPTKKIKI
jgi:hypothetical protein